jgi:hypothetical protein
LVEKGPKALRLVVVELLFLDRKDERVFGPLDNDDARSLRTVLTTPYVTLNVVTPVENLTRSPGSKSTLFAGMPC